MWGWETSSAGRRFRALLAVLIAITITTAIPALAAPDQQGPQHSVANKADSQTSDKAPQPATLIQIEIKSNPEQDKAGETPHQHTDPDPIKVTDWIMAISAIFTGIFTIVVGIYTAKLFSVGRDQHERLKESIGIADKAANAAVRQAESAIGVELPRLILSTFEFAEMGAANLPAMIQYPKIKIVMTNYGRTPAFVMSQSTDFRFGGVLPEIPDYRNSYDMDVGTVTEYGKVFALGSGRPNTMTPSHLVEDILEERQMLWVYGYVRYRDFLNNEHMARFCKQLLILNAKEKIAWIDSGPNSYRESF